MDTLPRAITKKVWTRKMTKKTQKSTYFVKKSHLLAKIVAICAVFAFILLLCGCHRTTPVEAISESATAQIVALEKTLPPECKTDGIKAQIDAIKFEIGRAPAACEMEKDEIRAERNSWALGFFALAGVLAFLLARKLRII